MLGEYLGGEEAATPDETSAEPALSPETLARLRQLGMDTDAALRYADNSPDFLHEELTMFLGSEPQTSQAMTADAQNADWSTLAVRVHGLKNNLATLGFMSLSAEAKALEMALRENGDAAGYESLAEKYGQLTAALRAALEAQDEKGSAE